MEIIRLWVVVVSRPSPPLLADFATGPQTRLIAIKVMRVPGNPLIKGTFWLDDVKLTLVKPQLSITRHRVTLPMLVHRCIVVCTF